MSHSNPNNHKKIEAFTFDTAPDPLGSYSHAVAYGDLLFICGMGPRDPHTNEVPGLVLDPKGERYRYDVKAETRAVLENLRRVLDASGSSFSQVLEMNVFLTNMSDFAAMNEIYNEYFVNHKPVRTTLGVASLPGKISVEMKAVAVRRSSLG
jgi:2-aminomuconate deaminase